MVGTFKNSCIVEKCCIIGLGLIGGSLGMALGRYGIARERWGNDLEPRAMEKAMDKGAVDQTASLADALRGAELVILAAPVAVNLQLLEVIAPLLGKKTLVTDVGSSKREIVEAMERRLPPGSDGVGGHPMAGSELSGIDSASPHLFRETVYFLTPGRTASQDALELMEKIALLFGARPLRISAREHDRVMAPLSHLPHLIAAALVNVLGGSSGGVGSLSSLAGGGFKDTTRIAAGDPALWSDILLSNADHVGEALDLFLREVDILRGHLERRNKDGLYNSLTTAASLRRSLK